MEIIELERWKPSADDPHKLEYAGQRTGREVFAELKQRLELLGLLPEEYFLIGSGWEHGEEIPKGADLLVTTDYGGSEGIYLDIYMKWDEDNKPVTRNFATGKTLGDTGADLDRMFLISSAITKAFHGDHGQYDRYLTLHPEQNAKDMTALLDRKTELMREGCVDDGYDSRVQAITDTLESADSAIGGFDDDMVYQTVSSIRVLDHERLSIRFKDGTELVQEIPGTGRIGT